MTAKDEYAPGDPARVAADLRHAARVMQNKAIEATRADNAILAELFAKKAWRYTEQANSLEKLIERGSQG